MFHDADLIRRGQLREAACLLREDVNKIRQDHQLPDREKKRGLERRYNHFLDTYQKNYPEIDLGLQEGRITHRPPYIEGLMERTNYDNHAALWATLEDVAKSTEAMNVDYCWTGSGISAAFLFSWLFVSSHLSEKNRSHRFWSFIIGTGLPMTDRSIPFLSLVRGAMAVTAPSALMGLAIYRSFKDRVTVLPPLSTEGCLKTEQDNKKHLRVGDG
ncbi:MAG: hypothetical protein HYT77_10575 [Deltaproteobacteria bacterium]|nr:hypothetical protein [Deltaproteobacteria bacterium]